MLCAKRQLDDYTMRRTITRAVLVALCIALSSAQDDPESSTPAGISLRVSGQVEPVVEGTVPNQDPSPSTSERARVEWVSVPPFDPYAPATSATSSPATPNVCPPGSKKAGMFCRSSGVKQWPIRAYYILCRYPLTPRGALNHLRARPAVKLEQKCPEAYVCQPHVGEPMSDAGHISQQAGDVVDWDQSALAELEQLLGDEDSRAPPPIGPVPRRPQPQQRAVRRPAGRKKSSTFSALAKQIERKRRPRSKLWETSRDLPGSSKSWGTGGEALVDCVPRTDIDWEFYRAINRQGKADHRTRQAANQAAARQRPSQAGPRSTLPISHGT